MINKRLEIESRKYHAEDVNHEYCIEELEILRRNGISKSNSESHYENLRTLKGGDLYFEVFSAIQGEEGIKYLTKVN